MAIGQGSLSQVTARPLALLLTSHGQPVQHGWWNMESVARGKLFRWVGEYGTMPAGRITPPDEATGTVMQVCPQDTSMTRSSSRSSAAKKRSGWVGGLGEAVCVAPVTPRPNAAQ